MKRIQMKNSSQDKTVVAAFEEFIKNCKVRNLSPRTIKYYNDYMAQFTKFLNTRQIVSTKEIKYQVVDDFILALKDSNAYKDITINL
jgi:site-specific recombinase XerD